MGVETKREFPFSVDTWTEISNRKPFHFLTHAHKDHTVSIDCHGSYPIYCSPVTLELVVRRYPKLQPSIFKSLEIGEPKILADEDESFTVTAFDANHCPGAIMLLFEGSFGNVLHTGDCRLTTNCLNQLPRKYVSGRALDCLYLDCTFGKETMVMPSKEEAIEQVKRCIWNYPNEATVFLACDILGQEPLLEAISQAFGIKIFVDQKQLPNYYADLELVAPDLLTTDKKSTRFQICEGFPKLYERATRAMKEASDLGKVQPLFIRPSAQWYTYEERLQGNGSGVIIDFSDSSASSRFGGAKRRNVTSSSTQATKDEYGVWHVCYSMHSSRGELETALKILDPGEVISTTGSCDLVSGARANPLPTIVNPLPTIANPLPTIVHNEVTTVRSISSPEQLCVLEARELKRGKRDYSCSPIKVANSLVESPTKVIPLFGPAQYVLPSSPPLEFPSPSPCINLPSPPVPLTCPLSPPSIRLSSPPPAVSSPPLPHASLPSVPSLKSPSISHVSDNRQECLPSLNVRSKRLFVELEHVEPKELVVEHVEEAKRVEHSLGGVETMRSFPRIPSRKKYRIPDPMPSLMDML